jgi:hypothetical protein
VKVLQSDVKDIPDSESDQEVDISNEKQPLRTRGSVKKTVQEKELEARKKMRMDPLSPYFKY